MSILQQKVFVIDLERKPLLPTTAARARILLRQQKAVVYQLSPFTIQLNRVVEKPVGSFSVGIDDGAKHIGVAIKNTHTKEIVFQGQIELRQDIKLKMKQRSTYRRARRYRLRYRPARFSNRISKKLVPSARHRKDCTLRFIRCIQQRLNIVKVVVEEVSFNHARHRYGKYFSQVEIGKTYLRNQILGLGLQYNATRGYTTKQKRLGLGLAKTHLNDAISIVAQNTTPIIRNNINYTIKPIARPAKNRKRDQVNGFKHYDLVKAMCAAKVIIGTVKSLGKQLILRTIIGNKTVSYSKSKIMDRPRSLIFQAY